MLSSGVPKPGASLSRRLDQRHTTSSTTINHIKPGTSRPHLKWVNGKAWPTGEVGRIPSCSSLVSEGEGNIPLERTREHSHLALGPGSCSTLGQDRCRPPPPQAAAAQASVICAESSLPCAGSTNRILETKCPQQIKCSGFLVTDGGRELEFHLKMSFGL